MHSLLVSAISTEGNFFTEFVPESMRVLTQMFSICTLAPRVEDYSPTLIDKEFA